VSAEFERSPQTSSLTVSVSGDLDSCPPELPASVCTLAALPLGARLILRCRKDWRTATVVAIAPDCVTLSVCSPSGHTYRLRRPLDAPLNFDGAIPLLGTLNPAGWRVALARYDARW
jgi:hypothetical protein